MNLPDQSTVTKSLSFTHVAMVSTVSGLTIRYLIVPSRDSKVRYVSTPNVKARGGSGIVIEDIHSLGCPNDQVVSI